MGRVTSNTRSVWSVYRCNALSLSLLGLVVEENMCSVNTTSLRENGGIFHPPLPWFVFLVPPPTTHLSLASFLPISPPFFISSSLSSSMPCSLLPVYLGCPPLSLHNLHRFLSISHVFHISQLDIFLNLMQSFLSCNQLCSSCTVYVYIYKISFKLSFFRQI